MRRKRTTTFRSEQVVASTLASRPAVHAPPAASGRLRSWLYFFALWCLLGLVAFAYVAQTATVTELAEEMEQLESRERRVRSDSNVLLLSIAQHQKAQRIEQEAKAMGLGPAEHVDSIEVVLDRPADGSLDEVPDRRTLPGVIMSVQLPEWLRQLLRQFGQWSEPAGQSDTLDQQVPGVG